MQALLDPVEAGVDHVPGNLPGNFLAEQLLGGGDGKLGGLRADLLARFLFLKLDLLLGDAQPAGNRLVERRARLLRVGSGLTLGLGQNGRGLGFGILGAALVAGQNRFGFGPELAGLLKLASRSRPRANPAAP